MSGQRIVEGIFAINKPPAPTSAQVLRDVQQAFNSSRLFAPWLDALKGRRDRENKTQRRRRRDKRMQVKLGHGGTLDPMATGVLIVGVGSGTKALGSFLQCTKTYETEVLFGASTDTYDVTGKLLDRAPYSHITREIVERALDKFKGPIMQRPPIYSALRVQGKHLYEYAREGKELPFEVKEREVHVDSLEVIEWTAAGEHDTKWPVEEAAKEEKILAKEVWKLGEKAAVESGSSPLKRRRGEDQAQEPSGSTATPSKIAKTGDSQLENEQCETSADLDPARVSGEASILDSVVPAIPNSTAQTGQKAMAPLAKLRMTVSSGFYVRSLCHDLGVAVGSLGVMASLVRTRQAQFELGANVLEYEDIEMGEDVWGAKVRDMLDVWQSKEGEEKESKKRSSSPRKKSSSLEGEVA